MTEFKNELIFKIIDKLNEEMWKYQTLNWGSGLGPDDVRQMVLDILMKELKDVMVIDRNKLKEKLYVQDYHTEPSPFVVLKTSLVAQQYFAANKIEDKMDVLKDRVKDGFIYKLEECDF